MKWIEFETLCLLVLIKEQRNVFLALALELELKEEMVPFFVSLSVFGNLQKVMSLPFW